MRDLRAGTKPQVRMAVDYFAYRIVQEVGRLAASLGSLDALVFTAGISEKDAELRAPVVSDASRGQTGSVHFVHGGLNILG